MKGDTSEPVSVELYYYELPGHLCTDLEHSSRAAAAGRGRGPGPPAGHSRSSSPGLYSALRTPLPDWVYSADR